MTVVCTSEEIFDGTIPAKELLLKAIYVTDLDRSVFAVMLTALSIMSY